MRVLSIDFDYFINAEPNLYQYFPDGGIEHSVTLNKIVWSGCYYTASKRGIDLNNIKIYIARLRKIKHIITSQTNPVFMIADSHKHIYEFIRSNLIRDEKVEIFNIDFHHDTHFIVDNSLNCGNWLTHLINEDLISKAYWIKRPLSYGSSVCTVIDFTELPKTGYDLIYICRSSWWTPPHLDTQFIDMLVKPVVTNKKGWECKFEIGIDENRYDESFVQMINDLRNMEGGWH